MAAFIIHHDFGAQENKVCYCFHFSLSSFYEVMRLDAQENKVCYCFHFSLSSFYEVMILDAMILVFSSLTQQKSL